MRATLLAAALLAGWFPAKSAALTPPAQLLGTVDRPTIPEHSRFTAISALLCALAAMACSRFHALHLDDGSHLPLGGYLTALFTLAAAGLAVPSGLPMLARVFHALEKTSPVIDAI